MPLIKDLTVLTSCKSFLTVIDSSFQMNFEQIALIYETFIINLTFHIP